MPRADLLIVSRGLAASRAQAQRLLAAGGVQWQKPDGHWQTLDKASLSLDEHTPLRVSDDSEQRFVSRGGLKLAGALQKAAIDVTGKHCIDIGQSTGGFTDCLLKAGAASVLGLDVGYGQLHESLRQHPRVRSLEKINARALPLSLRDETPAGAGFDLAVMDVSFISQTLILPTLVPLLRQGGVLLSLVKPQFETSREQLNKQGVVTSDTALAMVKEKICRTAEHCGLTVCDYFASPITGGDGNREFFIAAQHT